MTSALEGREVHGKTGVVREAARIFKYKSVPNADKREKGQKPENFLDILYGCPFASLFNINLFFWTE